MSSHLHNVCRVKQPHKWSEFLRDPIAIGFKKFTSIAIAEKIIEIGESRREWLLDKFSFEAKRSRRAKDYKIWTDSNHAVEIFGYISIEAKVKYIHENPVKAMIVYSAEQYVFRSAIDYADGIGLIKITTI